MIISSIVYCVSGFVLDCDRSCPEVFNIAFYTGAAHNLNLGHIVANGTADHHQNINHEPQ